MIHESVSAESAPSAVAPSRDEVPLAGLMRDRALALPARIIVGQGAAAVLLSGAMAAFDPARWGIALLAGVTVSMHAVWSVAVHRTTPSLTNARGWSLVRRAAAVIGTSSALALLFASSIALLGHLQS